MSALLESGPPSLLALSNAATTRVSDRLAAPSRSIKPRHHLLSDSLA
jgi:hypothetical protein